jgi:AcrR family transcriptional regulator
MATAPTRQRIIEAADELFYRFGVRGVGLDAIITKVGVTKQTFYNHFPSKDDLVSAVLEFHDRWWRDTFRHGLLRHGGDHARGQLEAIFDVLDELFTRPDFGGCIFVNVAVEFPLPGDPANQQAVRHKRLMEEVLREIAAYAGAADPAACAAELSLVMEGAYVTRQILRDRDVSAVGRRLVADVLRRHLGEFRRPHRANDTADTLVRSVPG